MKIEVGATIPNVPVFVAKEDGTAKVSTTELFEGKRIVLFSVPGAFTPTCSAKHLPGYMEKIDDLQGKGIDEVVCLSINDAFVMGAWSRKSNAQNKILMLADGNGDFTRALGLEADQTERGMGWRAQRAAMVLDDGIVTHLFVEPKGSFGVSSAEHVLSEL